jgi:hypothetical protein
MFFNIQYGPRHMDALGQRRLRGLSLWFGDVVRGQVVRGYDSPPTWHAIVNGTDLGKHSTREEAMQRVEEKVANEMRDAVRDWSIFQQLPKRPVR